MQISVAQNTERGKLEERPALSIFHCGRIKEEKKPWGKKKLGRSFLSVPRVKTKRTLSGRHLGLVAMWDLTLKRSIE